MHGGRVAVQGGNVASDGMAIDLHYRRSGQHGGG